MLINHDKSTVSTFNGCSIFTTVIEPQIDWKIGFLHF